MVCIYCGSKTSVTNSRGRNGGLNVWRRRSCPSCKAIFTTSESVDETKALLVQHRSQFEQFLRDKLLLSVYESLRHRKTALADATALTDTILNTLIPQFEDGKLSSKSITETTVTILNRFDKAAATHYVAFNSS